MARYVYLNENPDGNLEEDCVCRAITFVSGIPYNEVKQMLYESARELSCSTLCVVCYRALIENVLGYKPVDGEDLYPAEFADLHPYGTYLLRMNGHIVALRNGKIYDIFDSRYYGLITDAWRVD